MIRRIVPHPGLTLMLTVTWVLLQNQFSGGIVVFGLILGLLIPLFTSAYWPDKPRIRRPLRLAGYVFVLIWDIIVANVVVALTILFRSNARMRSVWIVVPLEIRKPEAITALAATITLTPGTVTADLSSGGHSLLVHCLDEADPEAAVRRIKDRYERRLKEIFE